MICTPETDLDKSFLTMVLADHGSNLYTQYQGQAVEFDITNLFSNIKPTRLVEIPTPKAAACKKGKVEPDDPTPEKEVDADADTDATNQSEGKEAQAPVATEPTA